VSKAKFVYVVYIATTAEKAWQALVQGEVTRQYWGHENVSDWKPGSRWEHTRADASRKVELAGRVVEVTPPRRLVITWARPEDFADAANHSRVTFELDPLGDMVRLTVTHDELVAGSDMERGIQEGWPRVMSSLKSFLETGKPLDTWAGKRG
jgi:uncharacterized protein YndB with AHSA1/START domain